MPINREIDRENYPEAISLCLQMLPRQPRYKTWLMKTLGDLYFQLGDLAHALKTFDDVLAARADAQDEPTLADVIDRRGVHRDQPGRTAEDVRHDTYHTLPGDRR